MTEATEELVKVYLERKGYLVTLSKRVDAKTTNNSPRAELDIVAVKTKNDNSINLPLRIIGEVKSYDLPVNALEELYEDLKIKQNLKYRKEYSRYKWINNKIYQNKIITEVNKEYGFSDFKFVLFCLKIQSKFEKQIRAFLKSKNIYVITHDQIIKELYDSVNNEYIDNQILQLLRLIKKSTNTQIVLKK